MLFGIYCVVKYSAVGEERAHILLSITCSFVVSVRSGFLFLWVLRIDYIILLWHSLGLPYNNFAPRSMKDECITVSIEIMNLT